LALSFYYFSPNQLQYTISPRPYTVNIRMRILCDRHKNCLAQSMTPEAENA
jgi:hypothetical protein